MTIDKQVFLYEILIRLGPEGYRGSHAIHLERIVDGDEVLTERELPATPLTQDAVGDALAADSIALIEATDAAIEAAVARTADAEARAERAEKELARLRGTDGSQA